MFLYRSDVVANELCAVADDHPPDLTFYAERFSPVIHRLSFDQRPQASAAGIGLCVAADVNTIESFSALLFEIQFLSSGESWDDEPW